MKILITGAAGFIGFKFSEFLLKKNYHVFGIDNLNNYYSRSLKINRVKELNNFKNFKFYKIDINSKKKLKSFFKRRKISLIINLAAQAGVRYSLKKPSEFVDNNILGFYNIIEVAKNFNIKKIIYASSSSIYGDSKFFPLKENQLIAPKNIYGLSKKINEQMANVFSEQYKICFIGLRFFTVYGEWGRPDMFMMKYLSSSYFKSKKFYLNNYGNHTRDFTYIGDVCKILKFFISYKKVNKNMVYNICSNKPIHLSKIMNIINGLTLKKPKIIKRSLQKADIIKTHGDNKKIRTLTKFKNFTKIEKGLEKTIEWFRNYYKV